MMDIEMLKKNSIDYDGGLGRFMDNVSLYEGLLKEVIKDAEFLLAKMAYERGDLQTMFSKLKFLSEGVGKLGIIGLKEKLENFLELAKHEKHEELDEYFVVLSEEYYNTLEILKKASAI